MPVLTQPHRTQTVQQPCFTGHVHRLMQLPLSKYIPKYCLLLTCQIIGGINDCTVVASVCGQIAQCSGQQFPSVMGHRFTEQESGVAASPVALPGRQRRF